MQRNSWSNNSGHLLRFFSGLVPPCSFSLFSSSVRRSLPGHAQTRTSKVLRPKTRPLEEEEKEEEEQVWEKEQVEEISAAVGSRTHSAVSRVRMVRIGRLFIPPMHELLHMNRNRMVLKSEPSWKTQKKSMRDTELLGACSVLLLVRSCYQSVTSSWGGGTFFNDNPD